MEPFIVGGDIRPAMASDPTPYDTARLERRLDALDTAIVD